MADKKWPVDFEWPTKEQILQMPRDKPFQFDTIIRWRVYKHDPHFITSIGITLSNGSESPMINHHTAEKWLSAIKEVKIPLDKTVRTIKQERYKGLSVMQNIRFMNEYNNEICNTEILANKELEVPVEDTL